MGYHGYVVQYSVRWPGKKSSYVYQRFFRALYGYSQVVTKSNGRRYVYRRPGVLTGYPFVKAGRTAIIIPENALAPVISFLKTGKNPAHRFEQISNWANLVKYSISETIVSPEVAGRAVESALQNTFVDLSGASVPVIDAISRINVLSPDEAYSIYYAIRPTVSSPWFPALQLRDSVTYSQIQGLLALVQSK